MNRRLRKLLLLLSTQREIEKVDGRVTFLYKTVTYNGMEVIYKPDN